MELSLVPGFPVSSFQRVHIRSVMRPIGVILGSSRQIGGASFETRRVPFSHFQRIEICSDMPHWGIPPSLQILSLLDLLLDLHGASHWGIPPSLSLSGLLFCLGHSPTVSSLRASPFVQIYHHQSPSSLFSFGVQSHHRVFSFGVQSHYWFSDQHSESSSSFLSFGVQSHHRVFSSAFKAIIGFQIDIQVASSFRRSEPSSVFRSTFRVASSVSTFRAIITSSLAFRAIIAFQFGVQSHHRFSALVFRAIIIFSVASRAITVVLFWLPEPSLSSCLGFQSHFCHLVLASKAITVILFRLPEPLLSSWLPEPSLSSRLGFQSHHYHLVLASRVITVALFRLPKPLLSSRLGFQSHPRRLSFYFLFKCLESALSSRVTTPGVHIRWLCASCLHGFTFSLGFSSLRYPVLIAYSSCSPHRVVPFGRILARTPGWFDRYLSLTLIS
ncbi:hypothetical protein CK203_042626 [Vitis vinifera]|uniref:Uncharacterized protein n=1 Tax=Vitis vinifera TaxID=29760 RepID=A0A438I7R2_VITVI|nr:hypothetical protein CK203_042626 [Vitis vinifera]